MQKALTQLDMADSPETFTSAAQTFDRIGKVEQGEWLPQYYAAFCYIRAAFAEGDVTTREKYLTQAVEHVNAGLENEDNSELQTLLGYAKMGQITVDPMTRGPQLTPEVMQALGKAIQMNPDNPRAYMVMGQMKLGTARFFGKGEEEACGYITRALELFGTEEVPEGSMQPAWGQHYTTQLAGTCTEILAEKGQ